MIKENSNGMVSLKEAYEKALTEKKNDNQLTQQKKAIGETIVAMDYGNALVKSVEDISINSKINSTITDDDSIEDSIFNFGGLNLQFAKRF